MAGSWAQARAVGERQRRWGAKDERACRQLSGTAPACWACWARATSGRELARRGRARGGARQAGTRGSASARGTAGLGVAWAQPVRAGWASLARLGFCAL